MAEELCKKCRSEGVKLFLKGEKCVSSKCPFARRAYGPGHHGAGMVRKRRLSEYGEQLREKQKVKKMYGLREKQFRNYFIKANKTQGITGENLLRFLEQRLDNTIFRLGFAESLNQARQMVSHAHIIVNGKKVNIASFQVKTGDEISISKAFKKRETFKKISQRLNSYKPVEWLRLDSKEARGKVIKKPQRDDIDQNINESLIVEYYSR